MHCLRRPPRALNSTSIRAFDYRERATLLVLFPRAQVVCPSDCIARSCAIEYFAQGAWIRKMSVSAELPPNLGMHGFWLANPDAEPLRFTKNPGESFFRADVVKINYLQERSASMLAPIADGVVPLFRSPAANSTLPTRRVSARTSSSPRSRASTSVTWRSACAT